MKRLPEFETIIQTLAGAKSGAIFIPENPTLDVVAASLSLFLSLEKAGKSASVVCASPMTVGFSQLVGVNKIRAKIGGSNLVISLDYLENAIDKVSYNIENKKFNLVIQPKPGFPSLSSDNVTFSSSQDLGLLIIIGAQALENLGSIYRQEEKAFNQGQILNIDIDARNSRFGKVNTVFPAAASYCEIIASLLEAANYAVDQDIANNLLLGIQSATNNFTSPKTSAGAFEAAAFCLKNGARRRPFPSQPQKQEIKKKPSAPLKTMSENNSAARPPEEKKPVTPSDWYGPKIFRGSKRI